MPFGLCNAPSTFKRLMEGVLQGLQWHSCLVYRDDVIFFSQDDEKLQERVDQVFQWLGQAHLKVKAAKCHLFARMVNYLGHVITAEGTQAADAAMEEDGKRNRTDRSLEMRVLNKNSPSLI